MPTVDPQESKAPVGIDVPSVTGWLTGHLGIRQPIEFRRLVGGHSNLTYGITDATGTNLVLRRPPMGRLLPTAHDVVREWRIIEALGRTDVPTPPALALCDDSSVTGAPFYVMRFVPGHVLHNAKDALTQFGEAERRRAGVTLMESLAKLHAVHPDEVGLATLGKAEGYISRQLRRWSEQFSKSRTRELPRVDEIHDFLASRIPRQESARVVHGDYRMGNCICNEEGAVAAVLDWEICTLGDPLADVGYVIAGWTEPGERGAEAVSPSCVPGFPRRQEMLEIYASTSGRDLSEIDYYVCFSHWKSACIIEGVYARYLLGALDSGNIDLEAQKRRIDREVDLACDAAGRLR